MNAATKEKAKIGTSNAAPTARTATLVQLFRIRGAQIMTAAAQNRSATTIHAAFARNPSMKSR